MWIVQRLDNLRSPPTALPRSPPAGQRSMPPSAAACGKGGVTTHPAVATFATPLASCLVTRILDASRDEGLHRSVFAVYQTSSETARRMAMFATPIATWLAASRPTVRRRRLKEQDAPTGQLVVAAWFGLLDTGSWWQVWHCPSSGWQPDLPTS
jgi:hypothetical protein